MRVKPWISRYSTMKHKWIIDGVDGQWLVAYPDLKAEVCNTLREACQRAANWRIQCGY